MEDAEYTSSPEAHTLENPVATRHVAATIIMLAWFAGYEPALQLRLLASVVALSLAASPLCLVMMGSRGLMWRPTKRVGGPPAARARRARSVSPPVRVRPPSPIATW